MTDFNNELKLWREARDITIASQKPGLVGNLLEETTELARAHSTNDVVDAMLDYFVYAANAIEGINLNQELLANELEDVNKKKHKFKELEPEAFEVFKKYFVNQLLEGIKAASFLTMPRIEDADNKHKEIVEVYTEYLNKLFRIVKATILIAGYDFDLAANECLKAIHSRKGKWSNDLRKFVKDPNQTDRYEPNYDLAKL